MKKKKLRLLTGKMEEENVIPPTCQDSVSLTNVTSQEASPLPQEVGNHSPGFTNERFCSLSGVALCEVEGASFSFTLQGWEMTGRAGPAGRTWEDWLPQLDFLSDLLMGDGVEYRT